MKLSLRITALLSTSCAVAVAAAACSDGDRDAFVAPPLDSGIGDAAHLPPTAEAGLVADAAPDASAAIDEPITCDVAPCAVDIVAGQNHFCVLMSDETVRCWGDDTQGALGRGLPAADAGDAGPPPLVSHVSGLAQITQISAAGTTTCARSTPGAVQCWGGNDSGQLGLQTTSPKNDYDSHPQPSVVALTENVSRVDVGPRSVCATIASGDVYCWGANDQGQLARPLALQIGGPAKVTTLTGKTVQTVVSTNTAFSIDSAGTISSWGAITGPEGAASGRVASVSPDPLPGTLALDSISSAAVSAWRADYSPIDFSELGIAHACVISRGNLYCWGQSAMGAMGFGVPFPFVAPRQALVRNGAHPQRVAVSIENTCVRMTDGTVQCAGDDTHGQLGRGADAGLFSDVFTPAAAFEGHAVRIALSESATCVIVRGGKVMCWGGNAFGELAHGPADDAPHPTPGVVEL